MRICLSPGFQTIISDTLSGRGTYVHVLIYVLPSLIAIENAASENAVTVMKFLLYVCTKFRTNSVFVHDTIHDVRNSCTAAARNRNKTRFITFY